MATDISRHLATIISARYGEEVRQAIHDAIQSCYTDGQWDVTAGQSGHGLVDLLARQQIDKILDRSTGNVQETRLWPSTDTDTTLQNFEGAWYEGQQIKFNDSQEYTDPTTDFDYIYVYYKPVITGDPELHIFRASTFRIKPSVISGVYFGRKNDSIYASMRKINISDNPNSQDPLEFMLYDVLAWEIAQNGTQTLREVYSSSDSHYAGTIVEITGVKYASVQDAVSSVLPVITGGANGYVNIAIPDGPTYVIPTDVITNSIPEITETSTDIQIETVDAGSPVEMHAALSSSVGDLSDLDTSDSTSLVNAINEVNEKASTSRVSVEDTQDGDVKITVTDEGVQNEFIIPGFPKIGRIGSLETEYKTNLVGAINEVYDNVSSVQNSLSGRLTITQDQKRTLIDLVNILNGFLVPEGRSYVDAFNDAWVSTVTGIVLNRASINFNGIGSQTLIATIVPSDATGEVTWSSSDDSVATVSSNGTVTAVNNGNCTITATCNGYTATCAVVVANVPEIYTSSNGKQYTKVFSISLENDSYITTALGEYGLMTELEELTLVGSFAATSNTKQISTAAINWSNYAPSLKKLIIAPDSIRNGDEVITEIKVPHYWFNNIPQSMTYLQLGSINQNVYWVGGGYFRNNGTSAGLSRDNTIGNTNGLTIDVYTNTTRSNGGFLGNNVESTTTINQYRYTDGTVLS